MKQSTSIILAAVLLAAAVNHSPAAEPSVSSTLVDAENAFSTLSAERGLKEAFLAYLCDDGIVFHPGPLNGRQSWKARSSRTGTLHWVPRFAEVAGDGDLGFTTGAWEFASAPERKAARAYGDFVSVWKRGKDGRWCVAADIGVSHERPQEGLAEVRLESGPVHPKPDRKKRRGVIGFDVGVFHGGSGLGVGLGTGRSAYDDDRRVVAHAINTMMSAERSLAFDVRKVGVARAYPRYAAEDVRFLREGSTPEVGITPAIAVLEKRSGATDWRPFGSGVSTSADLGYSYGLSELRVRGSARSDTSAYLHVWRKGQGGQWKLALDVENEFHRP